MLLMLAAPVVMAWYYYGQRSLKLIAVSVLFSLALSFICNRLLKREGFGLTASSAVTGLLIALMLPASCSYTLLLTAVMFSFAVASLPFGNGDKTPFVPAAAGIAFVTVCREASVFTYPSLIYPVVARSDDAFVSGTSLASMLRDGNSIFGGFSSIIKAFIGEYTGAMGATCALALLAVGVYMLVRYPKRFLIFFGYVNAVVLLAALYPRILTGSAISVVMELCSGLVLFGGLFLLTEPYCSPSGKLSSLLFGITGGVVVTLFSRFGVFEDSTCFAILVMNALSPLYESKRAREATST